VDVFTFPQDRASNTFQSAGSLSWTPSKHSIKFGADIRRHQLNSRMDRLYRPQIVFSSGVGRCVNMQFAFVGCDDLQTGSKDIERIDGLLLLSGAQMASVGLPSSIFQSITSSTPDSTLGLRFTDYRLFINDNWRIRPNLTLDYGLRYEYSASAGVSDSPKVRLWIFASSFST